MVETYKRTIELKGIDQLSVDALADFLEQNVIVRFGESVITMETTQEPPLDGTPWMVTKPTGFAHAEISFTVWRQLAKVAPLVTPANSASAESQQSPHSSGAGV